MFAGFFAFIGSRVHLVQRLLARPTDSRGVFLRRSFNDIMEDRILRSDVFVPAAANQNFR